MRGGSYQLALVAFTTCCFSCVAAAELSSQQTIEAYIDAFNGRDFDAMWALVDDQAHWVRVSGTTVTSMLGGREALRDATREYVAANPTARATLLSVAALGNFVQTIQATSTSSEAGGTRQCAATTYELVDGRIATVWYFDSFACPEDR